MNRSNCSGRWFAGLLAGVAFLLPSCTADGQISLFGYTSRPNYDPAIKTVYVPIFKNLTFRRGLEFDLTRAVIREIESKTTFKVVSNPACADTELDGTIVALTKNVLNITPLNGVREAETLLTVQLWWRDLRPGHRGELLSQPRAPGTAPLVTPGLPVVKLPGAPIETPVVSPVPLPPGAVPPPVVPGVPVGPPVAITSTGNFIPELGGSLTTAEQKNFDRLATQIVSMMEIPW
jgi:hypothetical protein